MLNQEIGAVIAELIAQNGETRRRQGWPDGCALPLFCRRSPQSSLVNGPLHEFAMHMTSGEITNVLKRDMDKPEHRAERLLQEHQAMLDQARSEMEEGTYNASARVEHNEKMIEGLQRTIVADDDAAIADGTIVQT